MTVDGKTVLNLYKEAEYESGTGAFFLPNDKLRRYLLKILPKRYKKDIIIPYTDIRNKETDTGERKRIWN